MTDEQRRAMFARMHGGGGSRGTRGASGPSGASGEPDTSYDPAANELSHIRPLGETSADEQPDPTAITYDPIRASEDRVRAIEQERDAIVAQRPPEPQRPDFSITDTRKLAADLMKQGKGTNEVTAAVKAAEAQNIARKAALERIKQDIRKAYPNDKAKQAQALSKYMQSLDARYQKQHDQWQKVSDAIDDAVAKANRLIEEEKARGIEERRLAEQKTRNAAASRNQKLTDAQERERLKQLAADKAAARRKAEAESKATKPAPEPKTRTAKDDVSDMTAEMKRRQFYWQSLQRGEMEAAMLLYPQADHMRNLQTLEDLAPPSKSKANAKAHKSVLAELEKEKP